MTNYVDGIQIHIQIIRKNLYVIQGADHTEAR